MTNIMEEFKMALEARKYVTDYISDTCTLIQEKSKTTKNRTELKNISSDMVILQREFLDNMVAPNLRFCKEIENRIGEIRSRIAKL